MNNEEIKLKIESLLFVSGRPITASKIASAVGIDEKIIVGLLDELKTKFCPQASGIVLTQINTQYQFSSNPLYSKMIQDFLKEDVSGELSKAALETLAVIAYKGPVTKAEIEQIRGVNCSLSLRNLLIRGLIDFKDNKDLMQKEYTVSFDFLNNLGLQSVNQLPEFEKLNTDERLKVFSQKDKVDVDDEIREDETSGDEFKAQ